MKENKTQSILVVFDQQLPQKNKKWYQQFDQIIAPQGLKEKIQSKNVNFIEIEGLVSSGSIQEASRLVDKLSRLTVSGNRRLAKLINYQGYELWWMNYDSIYHHFCIPYTQYRRLLLYLKDFDRVYLYKPPHSKLFIYFLRAYHRKCITLKNFRLRRLLPLPFELSCQTKNLKISFVFNKYYLCGGLLHKNSII